MMMDGEWTLAGNVLTWRGTNEEQRVFAFSEVAVPMLWVEVTDTPTIVDDKEQVQALEEQLRLLRGN